MMRYLRSLLLWGAGLGALAALFVYGSGPADHYWLAAPGWSRAVRITTAKINAPTPLVIDTEGTLYLFTIERDPQRSDLELLRPYVRAFAADGRVRWTYRMPVVLNAPEQPQMLLVRDSLHLYWLDEGIVTSASVSTAGTLDGVPAALPLADTVDRVNHYSVAADAAGHITLWTGGTRGQPGVYSVPLNGSGDAPVLVDAEGLDPQLLYDAQGALHAAWYRFPLRGELQFFYAHDRGGQLGAGSAQLLLEWPIDIRSSLRAYKTGLDAEALYLFWTESVNTGGQVRGVATHFIHTSTGAGSATLPTPQPQPLRLPTSPGETDRELAFSGDAVPNSLAPASAATGELAVAFSAPVPGPRDRDIGQIGMLFLQKGAPTSSQLLSTSSPASFAPTLVRDAAGERFITWLERAAGGAGYHVYLAGTSAALRTGLSQLTLNDVARVTSNVIFNMATGALLGPFVFLFWMIGPLLLLLVCRLWRGEWIPPVDAEFVGRSGAAIVVFWIGKIWTLPGVVVHVPFAEWVPVLPPLLGVLLMLLVPVIIGILSLMAARSLMRRVESPSPALFVAAYAAVDSVLTAAIYGSLLYTRLFQGVLVA